MFIRKYVYQFFFFNGGAMGIFEKIVLRSRYKLYISENSIITSMHIKRIVKDIYVYAILLKMKKKGTITGLRILLLSG